MSDPTPETLSSDERPERNWTPRRRFGRPGGALSVATTGSRATALTAALSLVLVGGVATAAYRALQSSAAPDTLVPANAFAFGSVDLSLSGGQDSALRNFLDHFSGSPTKTGSGSTSDRLLRALFKDSSDPHVDYDKDIKPWLGDHVAAAGWTDSSGAPQFEILVQSTDTARAMSTIKRLDTASGDSTTGVIASNGYVVVASSAKLATEALDEAKQKSLADESVYSSDIKELPNGDPAVGWVDGTGVSKLIQSAMGESSGCSSSGPATSCLSDSGGSFSFNPFFGLGGLEQLAKEHLAVGLHANDNFIQLDTVTHGAKAGNAASSDLLTQLPSGTVAGVEFADPGTLVDGIGKGLSLLTSLMRPDTESFASGFASSAGGCSEPVPGLPRAVRQRLAQHVIRQMHVPKSQRQQVLRQVLKQMNHKPASACPSSGYVPHAQLLSQPPNPLDTFAKITGLKFPDDVKTLLGDQAVITYGGLQVGSLPNIGIRSQPSDLQAAQNRADTLKQTLQSRTGLGIDVQTADKDLILASTPTYGEALAAKGSLGTSDAFRAAMGDVPSSVDMALYVNIANILTTASLAGGGVPDNVKHIKSIGLWATHAGDTQRMQFRFVVG